MDRLRAGQPDTVIKTILTLREDIPSHPCLKTLGSLLVAGGSTTKEMAQSAASYLRVVARDRTKRDQVWLTHLDLFVITVEFKLLRSFFRFTKSVES